MHTKTDGFPWDARRHARINIMRCARYNRKRPVGDISDEFDSRDDLDEGKNKRIKINPTARPTFGGRCTRCR